MSNFLAITYYYHQIKPNNITHVNKVKIMEIHKN